MKTRLTALLLALLLLCGCGASTPQTDEPTVSRDLTENVEPQAVEEPADYDSAVTSAAVSDFSIRLLQTADNGENVLISPLSVLCALSMTANGARNETLAQMQAVFGSPIADLNQWFHESEFGDELTMANGIWLREQTDFEVSEAFLTANANYYDAAVYEAPFDDTTRDEINDFVYENTDGMIENVLDRISPNALMYLVNALSFEAEWTEEYHGAYDRIFTCEDGTEATVPMMYSDEFAFLEDDNATGFIKYYKGDRYAFAALLPNEGMTVSDYLETLSGARLQELFLHPQDTSVNAGLPKFEQEYSEELSEILCEMGMTDAFAFDRADFTGIGEGPENIAISRVLHKTKISVTETGTKAGAATVVEVAESAAMPVEEPKIVTLDRPFLYFLIDTETGLPVFTGIFRTPA